MILRKGRSGIRVLLSRRLPGTRFPGLWEFPGGKLLPGEIDEEAAVRETREETGVDVEIIGPWQASVAHSGPGNQAHAPEAGEVHLTFVLCRPIGGVPGPWECQAVRWVSIDRLDVYEFPPANGPVLDSLAELALHPEGLFLGQGKHDQGATQAG